MFRISAPESEKAIVNVGDVCRNKTDVVVVFFVESLVDEPLELNLQSSLAGLRFQQSNENLRGLALAPHFSSFQSESFNEVA